MINHKEAERIIFNNIIDTTFENVELISSLNRVLGENIIAPEDSPLFNNSAMDGFAVKWDDVKSLSDENKIHLNIIGEAKAGSPYDNNGEEKTAVRISTGAMMPPDFDSIIPIENVEVNDNKIEIKSVKKHGQHLRLSGEEFRKGDLLIRKDEIITPTIIGLLASIGVTEILCYKAPKISIIITGSELANYKDKLNKGEIRNSNEPMLVSAIKNLNAEISLTINVKDNLSKTIMAIKEAEKKSDVIIISGGVSVGPHDHVKTASKECGFNELFWRVNQKPGKPFFFAKRNNTILFGLPGNPVSALMNFVKYINPVINILSGHKNKLNSLSAKSIGEIINKGNRADLVRVKIIKKEENYFAQLIAKQGSHMLSSISNADGFIILEAGKKINKNNFVDVKLFPWRNKWDI